MIMIEPVSAQNILIYRDVRLRALQDTPGAFGSTYAREAQLTDADWMERSKRWDGETGILYLAMDSGVACGMAGSFLSPEDASCAQLISMWIAPSHRKQGVGRLLVQEVLSWARQRGARVLQLMVVSSNQPAIGFYQGLGFAFTGQTKP